MAVPEQQHRSLASAGSFWRFPKAQEDRPPAGKAGGPVSCQLSVVSCQLGVGIQRCLFCLGTVKIPFRPDRPTEAFRPRWTEQVQSTDARTQLASKSFLICATLTPNWRPTAPSLTPARMAFTQQKSRSDESLRLLPFKDLGSMNGRAQLSSVNSVLETILFTLIQ